MPNVYDAECKRWDVIEGDFKGRDVSFVALPIRCSVSELYQEGWTALLYPAHRRANKAKLIFYSPDNKRRLTLQINSKIRDFEYLIDLVCEGKFSFRHSALTLRDQIPDVEESDLLSRMNLAQKKRLKKKPKPAIEKIDPTNVLNIEDYLERLTKVRAPLLSHTGESSVDGQFYFCVR